MLLMIFVFPIFRECHFHDGIRALSASEIAWIRSRGLPRNYAEMSMFAL